MLQTYKCVYCMQRLFQKRGFKKDVFDQGNKQIWKVIAAS